ncbi:hypothetical protein MKW98_007391 [Papaver atlanticum]|uniref:Uncharacterized protein n=1 Tax=Papaver atlanticum TaxID=357466 RepID=A0AAD4XCU0_9MAGN|nr:hypothetical protein MKW98_007391 [Papaver atlanticum]
MRRTAQRARRSSLTEKEREQILENRRSTYQMKRRKVGDATNNEGRAGTSSGMESDRGKRVRNDQEAGPSRGIEGNMPTRFSHLRRSPRFLNQDRMDEPRPSTNRATLEKICNQHRTRSSQHRHENKQGHAGGTSCDNERNVDIGTDSERDKKRPLEMDKFLEHHVKDRGKRVRNDQEAGPS